MNRRRRGLAAFLAFAAVVGLLVFVRENSSDRQSEVHRLLVHMPPGGGELRPRVAELGTNAIPGLISSLDWWPTPWERAANAFRFPERPTVDKRLERFRTASPDNVHHQAANLLAAFGRDAAPAVPALKTMAVIEPFDGFPMGFHLALLDAAPEDPEVRAIFSRALRGNHADEALFAACLAANPPPEALPAIIGATRNGPGVWFKYSPKYARRRGPEASAWIEPLAGLLRSNLVHRVAAADALAALHPATNSVLPALAAALGDPTFPTPCSLFVALGTNAAVLEPFLAARATNRVPLERILALRSLAAVHGRPAECVASLLRELRGRSVVDPQAAFVPSHDAFLDRGLDGTALGHRETACWLLGELGPAADTAVPALRGLATESSGWVPVLASWSLWRIDRRAADAIPGLARALGSEDPWQRHFAIQAVIEMGPAAAVLEPKICACAARDIRHHVEVAAALDALHPRSP